MFSIIRKALRAWVNLPLMIKGTIVISIPLTCILFSVIALYIFQSQRSELNGWILRAFHAGSRIQAVITLLADAESGTRGFLATRQAKYLEPLYKSRKELSPKLALLKEGLKDSPSQLKRIERIELLGGERMAALQALISATAPRDLLDRLARDGFLMDSIQKEFAAMRAEEARLWAYRIGAETTLRKRLSIVMCAVGLFSLLAGSLAMTLFVTGIVRRSQLLRFNAERLAHGQSVADLPPGTDEIGQLGQALARSSRLLSERESELLRLNQDLDLRVEERTSQLVQIRDLNEDLRRRAIELESVNKDLEAFSYSVSHDLRAPVRHIRGFCELLGTSAGPSLDEKNRRYLNTISGSAKELGQLIDDLLSFSCMGRTEMREAQISVERMAREVMRELERDTQGRNVTWNIGTLALVQGDRAMLRVVLVNLLSNALKYTRTRLQAEIEVGCCNGRPDEAVFFVRDNGVGFDMRYVDKLFGVFQRLHSAKEFEGTGIGLANVRRIIDRHGGRTWAESVVDGGATFYFSLPKHVEAEQ